MPAPKPPKETEKRRRKVENYLAIQMDPREVQARIEQEFQVTRRTVRNDINWVYQQWEAESEQERPLRRNMMRRSMRSVLKRALAAEQWNVAIQILDRLCKLDGLYAPSEAKILHSGVVGLQQKTSDDKRKRLFELIDQYGEKPSKGNGHAKGNGANGSGNGRALN